MPVTWLSFVRRNSPCNKKNHTHTFIKSSFLCHLFCAGILPLSFLYHINLFRSPEPEADTFSNRPLFCARPSTSHRLSRTTPAETPFLSTPTLFHTLLQTHHLHFSHLPISRYVITNTSQKKNTNNTPTPEEPRRVLLPGSTAQWWDKMVKCGRIPRQATTMDFPSTRRPQAPTALRA